MDGSTTLSSLLDRLDDKLDKEGLDFLNPGRCFAPVTFVGIGLCSRDLCWHWPPLRLPIRAHTHVHLHALGHRARAHTRMIPACTSWCAHISGGLR